MTENRSPSRDAHGRARTRQIAFTLALAATAGFVDAFGYATFGNLLVSHMSGNTAVGAAHLAHGHVGEALRRLAPIPAFVLGTAVGVALAHVVKQRNVRRCFAVVLGVELACIVAFLGIDAASPAAGRYASALLAVAMGIQSAAARHVAGYDVWTTFVTGMIVAVVDETILGWLERDQRKREAVGLHGGIWLAFFVGAMLGAAASLRAGALAFARADRGAARAAGRRRRPPVRIERMMGLTRAIAAHWTAKTSTRSAVRSGTTR